MSRYPLDPGTPQHEVVVGWDAPMNTFFGMVKNTSITDEEQDDIICWIGGDYDAVKTVQELQEKISKYATIPPELIEQLQTDQDEPWAPGPAQLWFQMVQKLGDSIKRDQEMI